jgi:hypothetical protein
MNEMMRVSQTNTAPPHARRERPQSSDATKTFGVRFWAEANGRLWGFDRPAGQRACFRQTMSMTPVAVVTTAALKER